MNTVNRWIFIKKINFFFFQRNLSTEYIKQRGSYNSAEPNLAKKVIPLFSSPINREQLILISRCLISAISGNWTVFDSLKLLLEAAKYFL